MVSICIPTYNRRLLLERSVESVIMQSYLDLEIIISDNNSRDETEEYCVTRQKTDRRLKYFRQEINIGAVNNVNFLIDRASGEYIYILADDDYLAPDAIEKMVAKLNSEDSVVHVACSATEIDPDTTQLFTHYFRGRLDTLGRLRIDVVNNFIENHYLGVLAYGLTRTQIAKLLPLKELFKLDFSKTVSGGEILHLRRLMLYGDIAVLPESLLFYMGPGLRHGQGSLAAELSGSVSKLDGVFLILQKLVIFLYLNVVQQGLTRDALVNGKLIIKSFFLYTLHRLHLIKLFRLLFTVKK